MKNNKLLLTPPTPSPDRLYSLLGGCARGAKTFLAIHTALNKGVFTQLATPLSTQQLAEKLQLDLGVLQALCALLHEAGMLALNENGAWAVPDDVKTFFVDKGPLNQRSVVDNLSETLALWGKLDDILESGPVNPFHTGLFGGAFLPALAAEALSGEAQRSAALLAAIPEMAQARDIVDLGGGHGLYALAACARLPHLKAEILDRESAAKVAQTNIEHFGDGRTSFRVADIFHDSLGNDRDAALLFYNPGGKNAALLDRIHGCLKPGGIFATKHAFYSRGEGGKDALNDLEWNLTAFPGVSKGPNVYRFLDDMDFEDYMDLFEKRFEILADHGPEDFAAPDLGKFGDRLDSRLIIARKR